MAWSEWGFFMASPQIENGYTKIANEVIEAMCRHPDIMKGSLFSVIAVVWRQTWGWNKKEDAISLSQFMEKTGLSKRTIIYALQELEAKNVLKIKRPNSNTKKGTNVISFNKDYTSWKVQNSAPQVKRNKGGAKLRKKVVQNSVKKVQSFAHTKETITKETKDTPQKGGSGKIKAMQKKSFNKLGAEIIRAFEIIDPKNKTYYNNTSQRSACDFLIDEYGMELVLQRIAIITKTNGRRFFPTITTPVQLRDKWVQLDKQLMRHVNEQNQVDSSVAF